MSEIQNNVPEQNDNIPEQNNTAPVQNNEIPGKGAAIASLVCGIVSLVIPYVGLIVAIIGLVLAANSKKAGFEGGLRTAGFVLSLLGVVFGAIGLVSCVACGGLACLGAAAG